MTQQNYRPDYNRTKALINEAVTLSQHEVVSRALASVRFALNVLQAEVEMVKENLKEQSK